jgi:hypothetical protein
LSRRINAPDGDRMELGRFYIPGPWRCGERGRALASRLLSKTRSATSRRRWSARVTRDSNALDLEQCGKAECGHRERSDELPS